MNVKNLGLAAIRARSMHLAWSLTLASGFLAVTDIAKATTYDFYVAEGLPPLIGVTGTLVTEAVGVLSTNDIVDWDINVLWPKQNTTLLGPLSGDNSSLTLSGDALSSNGSHLFFDFSDQTPSILDIHNSLGEFQFIDRGANPGSFPQDLNEGLIVIDLNLAFFSISVVDLSSPPLPLPLPRTIWLFSLGCLILLAWGAEPRNPRAMTLHGDRMPTSRPCNACATALPRAAWGRFPVTRAEEP